MPIDSPQKKSGYEFIPGRNNKDPGIKPGPGPLAGKSGTSTHYERTNDRKPAEERGKVPSGLSNRGYPFNDGQSLPKPKDATVSADGRKRVRKV